MSLHDWAESGWLRPHATNREEVAGLLGIAERDLADAGQGISADWKFGIAYNAALRLCTILLYAEGYRPERNLQHYRTIQALSLILGPDKKADVEYLGVCRKKRNIIEYDQPGSVSAADAAELLKFVVELRTGVLKWLGENHRELLDE